MIRDSWTLRELTLWVQQQTIDAENAYADCEVRRLLRTIAVDYAIDLALRTAKSEGNN